MSNDAVPGSSHPSTPSPAAEDEKLAWAALIFALAVRFRWLLLAVAALLVYAVKGSPIIIHGGEATYILGKVLNYALVLLVIIVIFWRIIMSLAFHIGYYLFLFSIIVGLIWLANN